MTTDKDIWSAVCADPECTDNRFHRTCEELMEMIRRTSRRQEQYDQKFNEIITGDQS